MKHSYILIMVLAIGLGGRPALQAQCPPVMITPCIPWFEDFEGYPHNAAVPLDACWAIPETLVVNNGVSPFVYTGYPYACHSGDNSLELKQSPVMVVFPEFANDIRKLTISFWGNTSAQSVWSAGTLTLGVITDINNPASFIPVDTIPATAFGRTGQDAPYTNFMGEHPSSGITPQAGMRIALRLTNTQRSWNLDDITITAAVPDLTADSYTLIGLAPETQYEVRVQANCGTGNLNEWSENVTGSSTVGLNCWPENSIRVFPNPAKEVVNVQCTMYNVQLTGDLSVFDVYGKLQQMVPITSEITPIIVSNLANGMYYVRSTTEEGMVTKAFVKK